MASTKDLRAESIKLNDGNVMPAVGLGTFQGGYDYKSVHDVVVGAVKSAIRVGIRHFDTAQIYDTERPLGEALRGEMEAGLVKRDELFVTTKLWSPSHRRDLVVPGLKKSLETLGLNYIDMFLIHWPIPIVQSDEIWPKDENGDVLFDDNITLSETWEGMEECKRLGLAKSIGISNFNIEQIQEILEKCVVIPANLQVESHPYFNNKELVDFCQEKGIVVTAFSPMGKPQRTWAKTDDPVVFTDPILNKIGLKHNKTAAQVALRFTVQRGMAVVPKSNNIDRQRENLNIFDFHLSKEDMEQISTQCNRDARVLWLDGMLGKAKQYPFKR